MIQITNLQKAYSGTTVLDINDLKIEKGKTVDIKL